MIKTSLKNEVSMKRVAVFAHFDKNNIIQDYVVYYLSELKKCAEKIIFVSDSDIPSDELKKIDKIVEHLIVGKHGEYDFGSYKRGFIYAKENGLLDDCEELIFANDSCYAPLYPFDEMFSVMSPKELDFWGVMSSDSGVDKQDEEKLMRYNHIQSYFIVFKPNVFNSEIFKNFVISITKQEKKEDVVFKYEMGMTHLLEINGFKYDSYSQICKEIPSAYLNAYCMLIKKERISFLKRSIVLYRDSSGFYPMFIKHLIEKYTNYDYSLIKKDKKMNAKYLTVLEHLKLGFEGYRRFFYRRRRKERLICFLGNWYKY